MDRRRRAARTVALMSLFTMPDTQTNVPIASFDGDGSDLNSLIVGIDPVQAGSGDPSPDNIRPISGWTGTNIHVSPTTDAEDGTTYSITFPTEAGTVYGGTLDVTTGKLTATHKEVTFDGSSDEYWTVITGYNRAYIAVSDIDTSTPNGVVSDLISNQYVAGAYSALLAGTITMRYGIAQINVFDSVRIVSGTTLNDWIDMLVANPLQVVYPLTTPVVYDLTPTQVTTLIGTNNIWADTGDIKYIEYNI